ncbi:MAG: hypothetical protein A2Z47_00860 [Thermodesulfovibrio sp. RBG_19FT_COMBO_42_12]|nr:MAG: hypothetical protein A2Z47_00860 [Thermodesulfovibrio sp. RBG_19FT_COMBO_42_12]
MSSTEISICAVCAWRATCQKKFSVSGKDLRCAEFVKDISIKEELEEEKPEEEKKDKKGKKS